MTLDQWSQHFATFPSSQTFFHRSTPGAVSSITTAIRHTHTHTLLVTSQQNATTQRVVSPQHSCPQMRMSASKIPLRPPVASKYNKTRAAEVTLGPERPPLRAPLKGPLKASKVTLGEGC